MSVPPSAFWLPRNRHLAALEAGCRARHLLSRSLFLSAIDTAQCCGRSPTVLDLIFKQIGTAQFAADVIMEMDAHMGFGEVLRSRKARDADELVSL